MEKKIGKKFYLLSALNLITAVVLGGGLTRDTLALIVALIFFIMNHLFLVKIVNTATTKEGAAKPGKILLLFFMKMLLLATAIAAVYFYDAELVPKVMLLMIFQLIIQVLSIKNNY
ncbi:MAG TPA: hypothetical protein VNJ01_13570 [Bacteriovoracaceae bacterium]|nr:hypothetical protein [Bacteriovoracaceae bacterium]